VTARDARATRAEIPVPPSFAALPQPLYIFDGICVLCSGFVRFWLARDRDGVMRFAPAQSSTGQRMLEALGLPDDFYDRSIVLIDDGRAWFGSTAVLRALRHLPVPWRWLRLLLLLPTALRDPLYRLVARNRYRWFGKRAACLVPSPDTRARFIDL
jgi:predicted DCC family thiol-disulfide oxidoreductase YuxK